VVTSPVRVSVVVPCYNAAPLIVASLEKLLDFMRKREELAPWEVLLVDDGSSDGTAEVVCEHLTEVRVLRDPVNRGKGAAVRRGMLEARGDYRFFIDADMPFDLEALSVMFRYLDFKEFDVCIGTRSIANVEETVDRTLLRKASGYLFSALTSRLVVTGIRDTQCGMKGFRGGAAEYLFGESRIEGFAFDVEVLYLAYKNDFDVKRVPVTLVSDDVSTVSVLRHALPMLISVLGIPARWYGGRYRLYGKGRA
jgi:dolichyl-phosphate beta-glucosyltransferase